MADLPILSDPPSEADVPHTGQLNFSENTDAWLIWQRLARLEDIAYRAALKGQAADVSAAILGAQPNAVMDARIQVMLDAAYISQDFSDVVDALIEIYLDNQDPLSAPFGQINRLEDEGRFILASSTSTTTLSTGNLSLNPGQLFAGYNGATHGKAGTFYHNSSTYGGTGYALSAPLVDFVEQIYGSDINAKRYGSVFNLLRINSGTGTSYAQTAGGITAYLANTKYANFGADSTVCMYLKAEDNPLLYNIGDGWVVLNPADGYVWIVAKKPNNIYSYRSGFELKMQQSSIAYVAWAGVFNGAVDVPAPLNFIGGML